MLDRALGATNSLAQSPSSLKEYQRCVRVNDSWLNGDVLVIKSAVEPSVYLACNRTLPAVEDVESVVEPPDVYIRAKAATQSFVSS